MRWIVASMAALAAALVASYFAFGRIDSSGSAGSCYVAARHALIVNLLCRGAPTAETFRTAGSRACAELPGPVCIAGFWMSAAELPRHIMMTDAEADAEVAVYYEQIGELLLCNHGSCD